VAIVHAIGMSALVFAGGLVWQRCVDIQVFENNLNTFLDYEV